MGKAKADHVSALLNDPQSRECMAALPTAAIHWAGTATRSCRSCGHLMREQAAQSATLIDGARAAVDTLPRLG